jgi:hypothetical protein
MWRRMLYSRSYSLLVMLMAACYLPPNPLLDALGALLFLASLSFLASFSAALAVSCLTSRSFTKSVRLKYAT